MKLLSPLIRFGADAEELFKNEKGSEHQYKVMLAIAQVVSRSLSLHQILNASLEMICEQLNIDAGAVWLLDEDGMKLQLFSHFHVPQRVLEELEEEIDVRSDPIWQQINVC